MSDDDDEYVDRYLSLPEVTLSAFTETGLAESSIIVPKQRAYIGRKSVISSRLANTLCATLGIRGLLDQLNTTLGTSYTLDTPSLSSLLEDCITNGYDFGIAYGRLRQIWHTGNWSTKRAQVCKWEEEDREIRRKALVGNRIVIPDLYPRRVWDLVSNRVVPSLPANIAWMDEKDRAVAWTPINRYEWPAPIPKDANLKLIRIEMLNLGAEYTWLDILCLRQEGGPGEHMRTEEWKLDVPTIGSVYDGCHFTNYVLCYLSGLGRPLSLKEGDLDSDRSWFRRAWTLQEIGSWRVIAGDTPDGPMHAECKDMKYETELLTRFHKQWKSTAEVFEALQSMQKRVSTNQVDKVAGLAFVMASSSIPAYYESESLENAWTALVNSMHKRCRGELFFLCPEPGNAGKKWRPSWEQVMKPLPAYDHREGLQVNVDRDDPGDEAEDSCKAECIEKGSVLGLDVVLEGVDRRGKLIVKDEHGIEHGFKITATHTYPIPEDTAYTLIDSFSDSLSKEPYGWVVGRSLPGGKFEKVSVLEISYEEYWRLKDDMPRITEERRYILI
ncbi:hypothetical protein ARMSODRAFT_1013922 [Armillaria solidipes]|uniref:Heterokaryon incompatibility domain-containing protein n=1 Tax=Armillaria solidipes TaxID=1076256 RepID=A0A2H3BVR0_9AGAR|nr:hypothetical protein ARMSODRAFT_1013922 [Armillaria solidipes]